MLAETNLAGILVLALGALLLVIWAIALVVRTRTHDQRPHDERPFRDAQEYSYGDFSIALPADHALPVHQTQHKLYDRFLPHLVQWLDKDDWIVDVGANCGDTLASMLTTNPRSSYLCIEADAELFEYLIFNQVRLRRRFPKTRMFALKALIGTGRIVGTLEGVRGTKGLVPIASGGEATARVVRPQSLEQVLRECPECDVLRARSANGPRIRLLKTDVDGYDFDVLESAGSLLESDDLIIFFECWYAHIEQLLGYRRVVRMLWAGGYRCWWIFDNFGGYLLRTESIDEIDDLTAYVQAQNDNHASRTMYYLDVLTCRPAAKHIVDRAIVSYRDFISRE